MEKRLPREKSEKAEESAEKPLTQAEAAEAMEKFKNLTRQLLRVPREKILAKQKLTPKRRIRGKRG